MLDRLRLRIAYWRARRTYRRNKVHFYKGRSKASSAERRANTAKWQRLTESADHNLTKAQNALSAAKHAAAKRAAAKHAAGARGRAVAKALSYAGHVVEQPYGSNRGGIITAWEQRLGDYLVGQAWCGTFVANMLLSAGVKNVTARLAGVGLIEDDARAGRGPFSSWSSSASSAKPGDLVVLFGYGVHVELVRSVGNGVVYTVGGNTSSGVSGSQSNGGGVFARTRSFGDVHGIAHVRYP